MRTCGKVTENSAYPVFQNLVLKLYLPVSQDTKIKNFSEHCFVTFYEFVFLSKNFRFYQKMGTCRSSVPPSIVKKTCKKVTIYTELYASNLLYYTNILGVGAPPNYIFDRLEILPASHSFAYKNIDFQNSLFCSAITAGESNTPLLSGTTLQWANRGAECKQFRDAPVAI